MGSAHAGIVTVINTCPAFNNFDLLRKTVELQAAMACQSTHNNTQVNKYTPSGALAPTHTLYTSQIQRSHTAAHFACQQNQPLLHAGVQARHT
jgi:hypothetical protein